MKTLVVIAVFCFNAGLIAQPTAQILEKAHQTKEMNYKESLSLFESVLAQEPDYYEALYEAAFLNTKIGKKTKNTKDRDYHYKLGMERAEKCLKLRPDDPHSWFIIAVGLGRMTEIQEAKTRVENSRRIRELTERVVSTTPDFAAAWHVLGRLHYRLSNMTMVERAAANVFYGGLPPGSNNQVAIECYKKAVALRPDYLLYKLDLASAYWMTGNKTEAKALYQEIVNAKATTEDDPVYKTDAASMIAKS